MPPCPFVYWQRVVPGMLYCCREMMHVFLKMDFGFKEILRFRENERKSEFARLHNALLPQFYGESETRLPGLSQIFKFECVTLRVLDCCTDSSIGCLFNNGSMNFNLSLSSLVFSVSLSWGTAKCPNTEIQLRMGP